MVGAVGTLHLNFSAAFDMTVHKNLLTRPNFFPLFFFSFYLRLLLGILHKYCVVCCAQKRLHYRNLHYYHRLSQWTKAMGRQDHFW